MGNYRSGRWRNYEKRTTVEDCPDILDIRTWTRKNILQPGIHRSYTLTSFWAAHDTMSMTVEVNTLNMIAPWMQVFYRSCDTQGLITYRISLQITSPYFGGLRWWFTCPVSANDIPCQKRVVILYRPSGARYFACRTCHQLTYTSCQQSHTNNQKLDRWFSQLMAHDYARLLRRLSHTP
jgi:hypothetical protein